MRINKSVKTNLIPPQSKGFSLLLIAIFTLIAFPLTTLGQDATPPETVAIEAEGVSGYDAAKPGKSREQAIEAALRDAVERASGVIIESESKMKNFDLVKDEVLSRSKGFVRDYKVLKEGRDGVFYKVNISAQVGTGDFLADVDKSLADLYRRIGMPRVIMAIQEKRINEDGEEISGGNTSQRISEKIIRRALMKQGFRFVDPRGAAGISLLEVAIKGDNRARSQAVNMARRIKAEIMILGNATSTAKGELSSFKRATANISLDVIRVDNSQIMASEVSNAPGLHISSETALVKALEKAAENITPKMMEQVTYQWIRDKNEGRVIEVVIKGAKFRDMKTIRKALGVGIDGVKKVVQRSFRRGVGNLELTIKTTADEVAEGLTEMKFRGFTLQVEGVSGKSIILNVARSKPVARKKAKKKS